METIHILLALFTGFILGILANKYYTTNYAEKFTSNSSNNNELQSRAVNWGWGNQLGQLEQARDPLDPTLWNNIAARVGQYPGGFADVVSQLQGRQDIPAINNLSV